MNTVQLMEKQQKDREWMKWYLFNIINQYMQMDSMKKLRCNIKSNFVSGDAVL